MDHSVKAMNSHRKEAFSRIFNRHRFENDELERLFQRYIFKLQHGSISSFVALFIVLTAVLAVLSFVLVQAPTVDNVYHSLHCLVFVVIFTFLATKSMEDVYLNYVCYCILLFSLLAARMACFMADSFFDNLRLRASVGTDGNASIGNFASLQLYGFGAA